MVKRVEKDTHIELLGGSANSSFTNHVSGGREAMFNTHQSQTPTVIGAEPKRIMTGIELENAKYDFTISFPAAAVIIAVINKYGSGVEFNHLSEVPMTVIIYEEYYDSNKRVGLIEVPSHQSFHQEFGHPLIRNPDVWDRMGAGEFFDEGTVIAYPPSTSPDGLHAVGVHANTVFLGRGPTIEDGFEMSESFARKVSPITHTKLVLSWGRKSFPLNLYGDKDNYKPFPELGDYVRDDGYVFCSREMDPNLAPAEMTPRALRTVGSTFDRPLWAKPGSRVIDIKVWHDEHAKPVHTPVGMDTQARKYYNATQSFHRALIAEYHRLKGRRKDGFSMTPEFSQAVVEALRDAGKLRPGERKLTRMHRLTQLDEWWVEITLERIHPGSIASKHTDFFGG